MEKNVVITETEQFVLLKDLGVLKVPRAYRHRGWMRKFWKDYEEGIEYSKSEFHICSNETLTDENFPNPSHIMERGEKFRVRAFKPVNHIKVDSYEKVMAFLSSQEAVYTGLQGIALVWERMRCLLPKNYSFQSYDVLERLPQHLGDENYYPIPEIHTFPPDPGSCHISCVRGKYNFTTTGYNDELMSEYGNDAVICFNILT